MLSTLAFSSQQPRGLPLQSLGLAGTSRVDARKLFAPRAQSCTEGCRWLVACAAVAASVLQKRGRDPKMPVEPLPPFAQFIDDFVSKRPDLEAKNVMKVAMEEWANTPAAQKKQYEMKASEAKAAYNEAIVEYRESGREEMWKCDPNRPKRPQTAYNLFMSQRKMSSDESAKLWKTLSDDDKAIYNDQQAVNLAEYRKTLEEYEASGSEEKWKKAVGIKALEEKEEKQKQNKKKLAQQAKLKEQKSLAQDMLKRAKKLEASAEHHKEKSKTCIQAAKAAEKEAKTLRAKAKGLMEKSVPKLAKKTVVVVDVQVEA